MEKIISKLPIAARILLGLMFFVFGLNGFLNFIPLPPMEGAAAAFMGGLAGSGYFFPLLKATEVLIGVALLSGMFVPLALVVLAPISLNIAAFHFALAPDGIVTGIVVLVLHLFLAWSYRDAFSGVLQMRAQPTKADTANAGASQPAASSA